MRQVKIIKQINSYTNSKQFKKKNKSIIIYVLHYVITIIDIP